MPQKKAFLKAIIDNPDDDAVRLVYADWLEEHGDTDRAEFIRLQIEVAKGADPGAPPHNLSLRGGDLLPQHEPSWRAGLPEIPGVYWHSFCGGFVEVVEAENIEAFLRNARRIFAAAPIRFVRFFEVTSDAVEDLVRS